MWQQNRGVSLIIRTDFTHPREWVEIQPAIAEPQTEEGFTAFVAFVDDRAYEGVTASQLLGMKPADVHHAVAFLVDTRALTHPDRPILVINLYDYVEGSDDQGKGPQYGATFRVVPSEMWLVQNNLTISNMDWKDFAGNVDRDGIFRGFE
ncbi:hypothetical protein QLQ12_44335 [Actinoplanes sp. NEAU-A12]|uniref:DUF6924 domain-containing protein n=1 Tax=Actinoplanes sandaracinus TaxID=3045177 RepID=A0ABT6X0U1_9ACTN|nr:hypothetical protein [Actinoplanes sandaracinus]MDI6105632.1 hypothetical protein [Actinoplanes sandaracinus]